MIDISKLLNILFQIFKNAYRILMILTPLLVFAGFFALYWQKNNGRPDLWDTHILEAPILIFSTIRFAIWYKIFNLLVPFLAGERSIVRSSSLKTVGNFLFFSFINDILRAIYIQASDLKSYTNWSAVSWPDINSPHYLMEVIQYFFKFSVEASGFLLPTTYGLTSLILALILHSLSMSIEENKNFKI